MYTTIMVRNVYDDVVGNIYNDVVDNIYNHMLGNLYNDAVGNEFNDMVGNVYNEVIGNVYNDMVGNVYDDNSQQASLLTGPGTGTGVGRNISSTFGVEENGKEITMGASFLLGGGGVGGWVRPDPILLTPLGWIPSGLPRILKISLDGCSF